MSTPIVHFTAYTKGISRPKARKLSISILDPLMAQRALAFQRALQVDMDDLDDLDFDFDLYTGFSSGSTIDTNGLLSNIPLSTAPFRMEIPTPAESALCVPIRQGLYTGSINTAMSSASVYSQDSWVSPTVDSAESEDNLTPILSPISAPVLSLLPDLSLPEVNLSRRASHYIPAHINLCVEIPPHETDKRRRMSKMLKRFSVL